MPGKSFAREGSPGTQKDFKSFYRVARAKWLGVRGASSSRRLPRDFIKPPHRPLQTFSAPRIARDED